MSELNPEKQACQQIEDFDYAPFSQQGGLGKVHQVFGNELNRILDEPNLTLIA